MRRVGPATGVQGRQAHLVEHLRHRALPEGCSVAGLDTSLEVDFHLEMSVGHELLSHRSQLREVQELGHAPSGIGMQAILILKHCMCTVSMFPSDERFCNALPAVMCKIVRGAGCRCRCTLLLRSHAGTRCNKRLGHKHTVADANDRRIEAESSGNILHGSKDSEAPDCPWPFTEYVHRACSLHQGTGLTGTCQIRECVHAAPNTPCTSRLDRLQGKRAVAQHWETRWQD